jgi:photosynthetic reaction center cytochrome c subunit
MNRRSKPMRLRVLWGVAALLIVAIPYVCGAQSAAPPPPKAADQAFKNIQTLKGIPADQLIPTMQFIAASLGVECEYCHVEGAFDKDDKKPKQTARKMMEMMFAINKGTFENRREVTCYSCHHGSTRPAAIPPIAGAAVEPNRVPEKVAHEEDQGTNAAAAVDPVLEKYISALGGPSSIQKVTTRVENGNVDLGGRQVPIEIYAQAPDKRLSVMHTPNGDSVTAYNGTVGWLSVPGRPTQWMGPNETDAARLDADLSLPVKMKQVFNELRLKAEQKIDGRDVNVLQGLREGKPPVNFYFDQQSGLLVRMVRYIDTAVGLNATQIDYADYRDSGGVKIPYQWTIARPRGQFTVKIEAVSPNLPIDERKFAPPPPAEQKPPSP